MWFLTKIVSLHLRYLFIFLNYTVSKKKYSYSIANTDKSVYLHQKLFLNIPENHKSTLLYDTELQNPK